MTTVSGRSAADAASGCQPTASAAKEASSQSGIPNADALRAVLEPIVRGQIRSFVNDHPEITSAVTWFKRRDDKTETFVNSVSKRIMCDLLCAETRVRLIAALGASISAEGAQERAVMGRGCSGAGVEVFTAPALPALASGGGWGAYAGDPSGAAAHYAKWPYDRITASVDRSPEGEKPQALSAQHESAGPQDDAQGEPA